MHKFGYILNGLLAIAFGYFVYTQYDSIVSAIFVPLFPFVALTFMHMGVYNTPKKNAEFYTTWKKLCHDDNKANIIRWASIASIIYTYAGCTLLFPWILAANTNFWKQLISVIIVGWPMITLFTGYSKGGTLHEAKDHYNELVKIFHDDKYKQLLQNANYNLNPDTKLLGTMVRTNIDLWTIIQLINELIRIYDINLESLSLNSEWNKFVRLSNKCGKQADKRDAVIAEGLEVSRTFCSMTETLGGIAIWITNSLTSKEFKNLESQLNN